MKEIDNIKIKGNLEFNMKYLRVTEREENIFKISDILLELPCLGDGRYIECHYSKEKTEYFLCFSDHIAYEHCYEEKKLIIGRLKNELERHMKEIIKIRQRISRSSLKELHEEWRQTEKMFDREERIHPFDLEPTKSTRTLRGFILNELEKRGLDIPCDNDKS